MTTIEIAHKNLTNDSRIRVAGLPYSEITVCTLAACCAKCNDTIEKSIERDRECGRETLYAWGMQHASVLSANYVGKAEAHAKKWAEINAAPIVKSGDICEIDGELYAAKVLGDYSDAVHFTKL